MKTLDELLAAEEEEEREMARLARRELPVAALMTVVAPEALSDEDAAWAALGDAYGAVDSETRYEDGGF